MVRLALGEPVQLLKVLCEGIVWTAAPGQNQKQELDKVIGCCLLYEGTSTLGVRFCFEKEERGGKKTGEELRESEKHGGCDGFRGNYFSRILQDTYLRISFMKRTVILFLKFKLK